MYQACAAIRDCLLRLGVGIDGGKDSLTMAAKVYCGPAGAVGERVSCDVWFFSARSSWHAQIRQ